MEVRICTPCIWRLPRDFRALTLPRLPSLVTSEPLSVSLIDHQNNQLTSRRYNRRLRIPIRREATSVSRSLNHPTSIDWQNHNLPMLYGVLDPPLDPSRFFRWTSSRGFLHPVRSTGCLGRGTYLPGRNIAPCVQSIVWWIGISTRYGGVPS